MAVFSSNALAPAVGPARRHACRPVGPVVVRDGVLPDARVVRPDDPYREFDPGPDFFVAARDTLRPPAEPLGVAGMGWS